MQKFLGNMEEYFQLKVIEPNNINNCIGNNELLNLIINKIKPIIESKNINFFIIPLPFSDLEIWWTDYAEIYLEKFYNKEYNKEKSFISFIIKFNNDLTLNVIENIEINHELNLEEKQIVYDIFTQYIPYNFEWSGRTSENMIIKYQKNNIKIDNKIIEETTIYPSSEIFIETNIVNENSNLIDSFEDNPFETDNEFSLIWDLLKVNSDIQDYGFKYKKDKCLIDFILYSIKDKSLIKRILDIKEISFNNFKLKVVDISGILSENEEDEYNIEDLK
tara:strand:+ start:4517 stop:5344 length:828 start_codon:yes stop_codon:yes gene_type:complete